MSCPITTLLEGVNKYQTLIAGLLALLGAWWTVRKISQQIRQTELIEVDRRERRNLAARTVMPAALAELIDYASACIYFLSQFQPDKDGLIKPAAGAVLPAVPAEALLTLRDCIEFGEKQVAEVIADMISKIQIQRSRLIFIANRRSGYGEIITQANIDNYVVDALEVHARAAGLFPYARRDLSAAPPATPTIDDVRHSAERCQIDESREGVYERIDRWKPNLERP